MKSHKINYRIYAEDTDYGKIIFHANYLKFFERARTEWLRKLNIELSTLLNAGLLFPVVHAELDYLKPGRLDDLIEIETVVEKIAGASILFSQVMTCVADQAILCKATIKVACTTRDELKPTKIPDNIKRMF